MVGRVTVSDVSLASQLSDHTQLQTSTRDTVTTGEMHYSDVRAIVATRNRTITLVRRVALVITDPLAMRHSLSSIKLTSRFIAQTIQPSISAPILRPAIAS